LKPSFLSATSFCKYGDGPGRLSIAGSTVLWIASVRSVPTKSAFSSGPRTGKRRPNEALTTESTVSASQMPCSTSDTASRQSACCKR
jgi:hypothetical protein